MTSKGSTCEAAFAAQSPVTSCSTTTYKRSSCLFLEVHLLPSDRAQTSIIIAWEYWRYMAVNCMWMFNIKLKLLSTQAISIAEQLAHMKQHWLFCNIINALWQPPRSRWLLSSLTTLTVRLSVCQSRATVIWYLAHTSLHLETSLIELRWHVVTLEPKWAI